MSKLYQIGIDDTFLDLFMSSFINRKQGEVIEGVKSHLAEMAAGMAQGSRLGPLLLPSSTPTSTSTLVSALS